MDLAEVAEASAAAEPVRGSCRIAEASAAAEPAKEAKKLDEDIRYDRRGQGCYRVSLANWQGVHGGVSRMFPCKLYGKDGAPENAKAWHAFIVRESVLPESKTMIELKDGTRSPSLVLWYLNAI